ncbi:hypothetical protein LMCDFJHI_03661 [Aeromonas salmonicida]
MSNINLLPWREARALRQKKQFGVMLGIFLAITASLGFAADWLVKQQISHQQQRNQRLLQEMTILDAQLGEIRLLKERRKELIDRMQLIEQLQMRRNLPVRLFNQLPSLVPNGVLSEYACFAKQPDRRQRQDRSLWQGRQHDAAHRWFRLAEPVTDQHDFCGRRRTCVAESVLHDVSGRDDSRRHRRCD